MAMDSGNGGQTDKGRGTVHKFPYSKDQRKTGKVSSGGSAPNDQYPVSKKGK